MKPFNRERFLFYLLAAIFAWQAALFTGSVIGCFRQGGLRTCPEIGNRYENTVNVMVATTLALLTGGAVVSATQRKPSASDPDVSASPPLQLQQQPPEPSRQPVQPQASERASQGRKRG